MKPGTIRAETASDILRQRERPLDVFFRPSNVAVIGASESPGSVGRTLLWNLISNPFGGTVFPVNPKRPSVLGIKAYPSVSAVPEAVDLAVVITPSRTVPAIIEECGQAGVRGAIVISAGFKEIGAEGIALEQEMLAIARRHRMRIIGPNCLGAMCPPTGVNATFASAMARPGTVGFLSQSGALCTSVLDWSLKELVGFSAFISIGAMVDVGWGDLIDYLGDDPHTRSILIYMESVGNARAFLSAAREVALAKPIIVIKAGRTEAAAKAAASHTGSMTGSDEVLDAAFRRSGVLRVNAISDLFYMAEILARQPRPKGPRLTILTNAGGPGVLATDALITNGGELAPLGPETIEELNKILPPQWSRANPIDVLGDAPPERYAKAVEIVSKDPNSDGLLVVLTPQAMTDPTQTAEHLRAHARLPGKPILASWMGGADVLAGEQILNRAGIPTFPYPDSAARAFQYMWSYSYNLRGLYETPSVRADIGIDGPDRATAAAIIDQVAATGRTILTECESKLLLKAYGIPTVETKVASTPDEAAAFAEAFGFPVVLKLNSETITHKTDVGGVQLNLRSTATVKSAFEAIARSVEEKAGADHFHGCTVQPMIRTEGYEIILGSSIDPQFGPVLLFGAGGQLVEVLRDRSLALPPLNSTLARRMMEQTRIHEALLGVRGRRPCDMAALEHLMVVFSLLVVEQRRIKEIDINPLMASPDGHLALDARVVLHDRDVRDEDLPRLAIRPYPIQHVTPWVLKDGSAVTVRPIRPEDEPLVVRFHETLSEESVYMRYFHAMKLSQRVAHDRLVRICFIDYDREIALVAERDNPQTGDPEILGVARFGKIHGTNDAEFSMLVGDRWQGLGLGTELLSKLIEIGRDEKVARIIADILPENYVMQHVCEKLGFKLERTMGADMVKAAVVL
ncbi:MAG TPA: bifunctional acetate--CoA ligase family protein/GNAT family N-acetyltransferase [Chthonomonadales bacterium]|nr:bifunctional acetate--CoA ligase family protein/GNAT family N-acetyltransferase [Chthonomonadales bacterium]